MLEHTPLELDTLLGGASVGVSQPNATNRDRQLPRHSDQMVELVGTGLRAYLIAKSTKATGSERLLDQPERNVHDGSIAERLDAGLIGPRIGAGILDHDGLVVVHE